MTSVTPFVLPMHAYVETAMAATLANIHGPHAEMKRELGLFPPHLKAAGILPVADINR